MCFPNICILWAIALNKKVDLVRQRGYIRIRQRCVFVRSGFGVVGFFFFGFFLSFVCLHLLSRVVEVSWTF